MAPGTASVCTLRGGRHPAGIAAIMLVAIMVVAVISAGCLFLAPPPQARPGAFRERTVVLSVEGTPGLAFEGSYGTVSRSTSARGIVPAQYTVKTSIAVVASFTKTGPEGELVVRIMVDGREVQRRSTSAPFGTIIVSQRFSQ